jgi:hypothetical protein
MKRMTGRQSFRWLHAVALLVAVPPVAIHAQAPAAAEAGFTTYVGTVERRLAEEHQADRTFLAGTSLSRAKHGELVIEKLMPDKDADPPGAMLHDWRGTAFAPGATPEAFERLMRNFSAYPRVYAPQVMGVGVAAREGEQYKITMRVVQKHVFTVVMDTAYHVTFGRRDPTHGWSASRSTKIREIENSGTDKERALGPKEEHGFLWRLNTYWTYEARDGGLYLQIESVSLTRAIPPGLGWAVRPFVESVPRESLEFTLRKTCEALEQQSGNWAGRQ